MSPASPLALAPGTLLSELTRPWAPPRGSRVLAAVSGGADSVALLRLLAVLAPGRGWSIEVACLDHGLRGPAGAADVAFTDALARELGLPFHAGRAPAGRGGGVSPEAAARAARRAFLGEIAHRAGAAAIALAHTLDDQAETVLFRLARGTGLAGTAAMRRRRGLAWRPLLGVRRATLRTWLGAIGAPWREDETNLDPRFTRNRVRLELLPVLERCLGPGALPALARAAALAAEDEQLLRRVARRAAPGVLRRCSENEVEFDRRAVLDLPRAVSRRILRGYCDRLAHRRDSLSAAHVFAVESLVRAEGPGTRATLPSGITARRKGSVLVLERRTGRGETR